MTEQPIQITLQMTGRDFERLWTNSGSWGGSMDNPVSGWRLQVAEGRFEHMDKEYDEKPGLHWRYFYSFRDSWTDILLARAFLKVHGYGCEVLWDLAEDGGFIVLTDYASPIHRRDTNTPTN